MEKGGAHSANPEPSCIRLSNSLKCSTFLPFIKQALVIMEYSLGLVCRKNMGWLKEQGMSFTSPTTYIILFLLAKLGTKNHLIHRNNDSEV